MRRFRKTLGCILLLLLVSACSSTPEQVVVTQIVQVQQEVTATSLPPTAAATPTDTPIPPTETAEPTPEATSTLSPIRATQQALADMVVVPTSTPSAAGSNVDPDDYPSVILATCDVVRANYVRDDLNGLDWDAICDDYFNQAQSINSRAELYELLDGLIDELDDGHSRFVNPDNFAAEFNLPTEGSGSPWPGLQLSRAREDDRLKIWYVCRQGPAADAGLRRGDVVLAINDWEAIVTDNGPDYATAVSELYSREASVDLTVLRGPTAEPEIITIPFGGASGCWNWGFDVLSTEPYVGYLRVPNFGNASDSLIEEGIGILEETRPLDGLVIDVRHNPGGNSDRDIAIFTTGVFGEEGPLRADSSRAIWRIRGPVRWNEETPVVVLTDGGSASAAEYFSTAMQQSGRAVIVGMPTAGNTEGINSFSLPGGIVVRLAWTALTLPDGSSLEGIGVIPDILVPLGEWGLRESPDVQLAAGLDTIQNLIGSQ